MWRRTTRDRLFIGLLLLATVTVLTLDFRTGLLQGLASATSQVVGVFQAGVRTAARPVEALVEGVQDLGRLRGENDRLRTENEVLRRQAETYTDLARENARMRELIQIEGSLDLETIRARVIGASLSGLERTTLIDKGRNDGIVEDTAVLAPEGLVGRISWVGPRTAKVLLITDPESAIGVRIGETGETGIVKGGGDLRLELVERAALDRGGVKRRDIVLTSGYQGGIFPPGIPIGQVQEVDLSARGTAYTIIVRPFAQLTRLDLVSVVVREELPAEAPPQRTQPAPDE